MTFKFRILLLGIALFGTHALQAKDGIKVGVVDMQKVILSVGEGKAARADLEKEIKAKETEFQKKKEELDKLNKDWKDQGAVLSEEAKMRKQKDFQEKFMDMRNAEMAFQSEVKRKEGVATQKIAMKVSKIVNDLGTKKELDMVFETNSSGLMYAKNPVDLTPETITLFDKENKVAVKDDKKDSTTAKADQ